MALLRCQQDMLSTRQDLHGEVRLYRCDLEKTAATVVGPGPDTPMLIEICRTCIRYMESTPS